MSGTIFKFTVIACYSEVEPRAQPLATVARFTELDILKPFDERVKYGKTYSYKNHINIFNE